MLSWRHFCLLLGGAMSALLGGTACSAPLDGGTPAAPTRSDAGTIAADLVDVPLRLASADELAIFNRGDALFGQVMREADGLGPLYIRTACSSCHERGG